MSVLNFECRIIFFIGNVTPTVIRDISFLNIQIFFVLIELKFIIDEQIYRYIYLPEY